jgi:DNA polymerase I-like protein with 3'-5' exonuclease and polymerase domains
MKIIMFDLETTGLDTATVDVHCGVLQMLTQAGPVWTRGPAQTFIGNEGAADMAEALGLFIAEGFTLAGHNIVEYDLPVMARFGLLTPPDRVLDTLVMSRAIYPGSTLHSKDLSFLKKRPDLRDDLRPGAHSLKSWGLRLDCPKADYTGGWETFSQEMLDYCVQDVGSNCQLFELLASRIPTPAAVLENQVAIICRDMRKNGVEFDVGAAQDLAASLAARRAEIASELMGIFPSWVAPNGKATPKRTQKRKHFEYINGQQVEADQMVKGKSYIKCKLEEFNPASTEHIANRLIKLRGWKPKHYTPSGKVQVTAEILRDLPWPEAALLSEYQEIKKIIGYLSEGTGAWLKLELKGRLNGKVNPTGTVSGRAAHSRPNLGNVPARSKLGKACRSLFIPKPGQVLVGADASGLQLRILGHYLAPLDNGSFARQCETGDVHAYNQKAIGLRYRANAKTWIYARLFGAGAGKLGQTVHADLQQAYDEGIVSERPPAASAARRLGAKSLKRFGDNMAGFNELGEMLASRADDGFLKTLDGRQIPISSDHIALAMLLQGGEAVIMKRSMATAAPEIRELGGKIVLWVHDEFQVECPPEAAEAVGAAMVAAIRDAGTYYNLNVALDGEYKVGTSWADTH